MENRFKTDFGSYHTLSLGLAHHVNVPLVHKPLIRQAFD